MEDDNKKILDEITNIESLERDFHKIRSLNESINEVYVKNKIELEKNLKHITEIFKNKLKQNEDFASVVEKYVQTFVKDEEEIKESAREELFLILAAEILGMIRGISHTNPTMNSCSQM